MLLAAGVAESVFACSGDMVMVSCAGGDLLVACGVFAFATRLKSTLEASMLISESSDLAGMICLNAWLLMRCRAVIWFECVFAVVYCVQAVLLVRYLTGKQICIILCFNLLSLSDTCRSRTNDPNGTRVQTYY